MTEEKRRPGRPPKEKPDNAAAAVATPVAADSGQAEASIAETLSYASAEYNEAVVENPTIVQYADGKTSSEKNSEDMTESSPSVQSAAMDGLGKLNQESPIEQKIHELVEDQCPDGWNPISTAPKDGNRIVVSETGEDQEAVYWRIRRVVDKKKLRYNKEGKWTAHLSRLDIDYEPKYWRPYNWTDYIPWPRAK